MYQKLKYDTIQCMDCGKDIEKRGNRIRCCSCSNKKHNIDVRIRNNERKLDIKKKRSGS